MTEHRENLNPENAENPENTIEAENQKNREANDQPITCPEHDRLNFDELAQNMAASIRALPNPYGNVLAINGTWGSGKSSLINLIKYHLITSEAAADANGAQKFIPMDFHCWWFKGEENLTLNFMQELSQLFFNAFPGEQEIKHTLAKITKSLMPFAKAITPLIQLAPAGSVGAKVAEKTLDAFEKTYFSGGESVEKAFETLKKILAQEAGNHSRETPSRFLVFLDDLDRLSEDELFLMFRLIKTVGHLPNVTYILSYDRHIAEKVIANAYPAEGPHFLEKIIQYHVDIPPADEYLMEALFLRTLQEIKKRVGDIPYHLFEEEKWRFSWATRPFLTTPREIIRLKNNLIFTYPMLKEVVNFHDFVALEIIRLQEYDLYKWIFENREVILNPHRNNKDNPDITADLPDLFKNPHKKERLLNLLDFILSISDTHPLYGSSREEEDDASQPNVFYQNAKSMNVDIKKRRLHTRESFHAYFKMAYSLKSIPKKEIDAFLNCTNPQEYVENLIKPALEEGKQDQQELVRWLNCFSLYLDEMKDELLKAVLILLFQYADEINNYLNLDVSFSPVKTIINRLLNDDYIELRQIDIEEVIRQAVTNIAPYWGLYFLQTLESNDYLKLKDHNKNIANLLKNTLKRKLPQIYNSDHFITQQSLYGILLTWQHNLKSKGLSEWCLDYQANPKKIAYLAQILTDPLKNRNRMRATPTQYPKANDTDHRQYLIKKFPYLDLDRFTEIARQFMNEEIQEAQQLTDEERGYIEEYLYWRDEPQAAIRNLMSLIN